MRKLQLNCLGRKLSRAGILGASVLLVFLSATCWGAPANDNFTNATVITGPFGNINGSNILASAEPGEPVIAGVGGRKTIWYKWTAPFTGTILFNTEGSDFDTVMGVYTGTSVSNLTLVAQNDDVVFPTDLSSQVIFPVASGTVYYIAVDGNQGDSGDVKLSWTPTGTYSAGQFGFASGQNAGGGIPLYVVSPYDSLPTSVATWMDQLGLRARVIRTAGNAGNVIVSYSVTNTAYTNYLITNVFGTNIYSTNIDTNTMQVVGTSNNFFTNYFSFNRIQDFANGQFFFLFPTNAYALSLTNINGVDQPGGTIQLTAGGPPPSPCANMTMPVGLATNGNILTMTTTSIFCTNIVITNIISSAVADVDYIPDAGNITMVDYQMGADIPYIVLPFGQPFASTNIDDTMLINKLAVVTITSVAFGPGESTNTLAPPIITTSSAFVEILNDEVLAGFPDLTTNIIANFIKTVDVIDEIPIGAPIISPTQRVARVWARRTGFDGSASLTVNVVADQVNPPFGPIDQLNTFPLQPGSDYATPTNSVPASREPQRFTLITDTVTWGAFDFLDKPIDIVINYDPEVQFNEDILLELYLPPGTVGLGQINTETLTIMFNDQPAGAVDRDHNPNLVQNSNPPFNPAPGAGGVKNTVLAVAVQPDSKTVFGGDFQAYDTTIRNRIARMNVDGSLDTGFMAFPNSGADDTINCLALQPDGHIIIGGVFKSFNATSRAHIARLNADGTLDETFNPGIGANASVSSMALQPDGGVIIAGDFTSVNATNRSYIARLNSDGSLDTAFDPGLGPNDTIEAIALQGDGKVIIGGNFTSVDNVSLNYIARLNTNGTLDATFNPGLGADQPVLSVAVQTDGKILAGGIFSTINVTSRNSIARMNGDGSIDLTFDPGTGADGEVDVVTTQPDGKILIGGHFLSINETRRVGLARLKSDGSVDTTFLDTAYNQFAGLVNLINNPVTQPRNYLHAIAVQPDGNIIIGGRFSQLGGGVSYALPNPIFARDVFSARMNIARLIGGSTPGPGNIGLAYPNYTADKADSFLYVSVVRSDGDLGDASANLSPTPSHTGLGNATPDADYVQTVDVPEWPTTAPGATWMASDDLWESNNLPIDVLGRLYGGLPGAFITTLDNPNSSGNLGLVLQLSQPTGSLFLGGEPIPLGVALGEATAPMTIIDENIPAGILGFSTNHFFVNENATNAIITVTRTNGSTGPITVQYQTLPATAQPGATNDYVAVTGTLVFDSGDTSKSFVVPIINNFIVRPDRSLTVSLFNATGGGTIGAVSNAVLTIINDNFLPGMLSFATTNFGVNENAGSATISVVRLGGSQGTEKISYATSDGSAVNGLDYLGTNGVLTWNSGETTPKTFTIPLLNQGLVNSNSTVNLTLSNPLVNGLLTPNALQPPTNAVLTITNEDFFGNPTLSAANYFVNENAGVAVITVNRLGGSSQTITVDYATTDGTAHSADYTPTFGTLTFTNGQFSQSFTVPIINNTVQTNNDTFFTVVLSNPTPASGPGGGVSLGNPASARVTILANQVVDQPPGSPDSTFNADAGFNGTVYSLALQSDGSLVAGGDFTTANGIARNRIARLNGNGLLDVKFSSGSEGANGSIRSVTLQTDGQILIGGLFTTVNGVNQNYISRLNFDGSLDSTFNFSGQGADNPVYAIAETFNAGSVASADRKIVIGGSFASVDGVPYRAIAELNEDGTVDTTFNAAGANGTVYAVAVYSTNDVINGGKILIGGDFTMVNGTNVGRIARLNADGTLDTSFNNTIQGSGPGDSVRTIAIQVDGKVLIGGLFTSVSGVPLNYYARLDAFGQIDPTFNVGVGANDPVTAILVQQDQNIVLGGTFTQASGVTRNRLTRLNSDGTVDASINFGLGANDFVDALVVQPDGKLFIGGGFTQFDGQSKPHLARLFGGSITGSGTVEFSSANYQVNEGATNVVISVRRVGGTGANGPGGYNGPIVVVASTSDDTARAGIDYIGVTNLLTFQVGETFQTITVPILNDPTNLGQLVVDLNLANPTSGDPSTFAQLGDQSEAFLTIIGANSTVSFSSPFYAVNKNTGSGGAVITVNRNDSSIGAASVQFYTTTNGTATPGLDYTPTTNTLFFAAGQTNQSVVVPIINNGLPEGNLTVGLALINPTNTILDPGQPTTATLTIVDNSLAPGTLAFSAATGYTVSQTATNALITIVRNGGSIGQVSVNYTVSGGTATPGTDYTPVSGILTFLDGQTSRTFLVPILDNTNLTSDVTVNLTLSQPTGGTAISGPDTVPLTIQNANFDVSFAQAGYFVDEKSGNITIGVNRFGSTNGTISVHYATANGTAQAGVNYTPTSGTLNFLPGQTLQTFIIPITYDPQITGNLIFFVNLSKAGGSPVSLVNPVTATVTVLDDDSGFSLLTSSNSVVKATTNAIISVLRSGNTAGSATVGFLTTGGTAVANSEYVPTNGVLTFISGQTSNSFAIPILNDNQIDGDQTVFYSLINPTAGAQLLSPSDGVLTIIDNESGFSFSSPNYTVKENGVSATITVVRSGVSNGVATVNYSTSDGTAHAGGQYVISSGTLTFTNGQTSATFNVPIVDNNVTGGSETVLLLLSNPSASGALISPSAATLTILNNDGSVIVAAGAALLVPTNGIINPGTNVTVLLSLLNTAGADATNVMATLLATNGVTPVGSPTQDYGNLLVGGPSVFRPFTFTAAGANGSSITGVLQLSYGTNVTTVTYGFTLGTSTNLFTNSTFITINDLQPAIPYPSSITVTSLVGGVITKATATLVKLGHAYVSDVSVLLVGPTAVKELLMEQTGGPHTITNVTLTFDSTAPNALTTSPPTSGTYRPSPLQTGVVLHPSTNGVPAPAPPYGTNLADFNGTNPNGVWSLYVDDDKFLDTGSINGGWILGITTLNVVTPNVDLAIGLAASPNPVVVSNNLTYTLSVTNAGPSPATGVTVTNLLPAGVTLVSATSSQGACVTNAGSIICTLGSLATNGTATVTIVVNPTLANLGPITDVASVGGNELEDNPANNSVSLVSSVVGATADLAIGAAVSPSPDFFPGDLTFTITVTNLGPATAPGVFVTNTLPAGAVYVSNTAPGGYTNAAGFQTFGLGNLAIGVTKTFTLVIQPETAGTAFNTFGVGASIPDPLKGNNTVTVKSVVELLPLGATLSGNTLKFTWLATGSVTYALQSTTSLNPPNWVNVGINPTLSGGVNTLNLPVGPGVKFFRLIGH